MNAMGAKKGNIETNPVAISAIKMIVNNLFHV